MLGNQAQAATIANLLNPVSAANTAAATSSWVDVTKAEGDILFDVKVGALTGSITWTIEDATDGSGTGAATMTPLDGAFTAGAANQTQKRCINAGATRGFVRLVGAIVTGPALVAASLLYHPKYV